MNAQPYYCWRYGIRWTRVSAISVPRIKKLIRNVNFQDAKALANAALQKPTASEIEQLIEEFFWRKMH